MTSELMTTEIPNLFPYLETILQDGGKKHYSCEEEVNTFRMSADGLSGFSYHLGHLDAKVGFGVLLGGAGFVIKRVLLNGDERWERFDYFNSQGQFTYSSEIEDLKMIYIDTLEMDLSCPILNHLYNYLNLEYRHASEGKSRTEAVHAIEIFLRSLHKSFHIHLPVEDKASDSALINIYNKILNLEMDPVLTWEERQLVYRQYKDTMNEILKTKIRAHRLSKTSFKISLMMKDMNNFAQRLFARPTDNSKGIFYRYTIGKVIWFFQTVKNNLGYSIALAVYGPFTYYFITMPMNPHAMQAVGRVRSTYLDLKTGISEYMDKGVNNATVFSNTEANAEAPIKITQAAPTRITLPHVIYPSFVNSSAKAQSVHLGDGEKQVIHPKYLNMLIATDISKVDHQSWLERMSNFKQMQIAYEENIEFASRMGRLEQLETQYNFPMQVESTWEELERYNNLIFKLREQNPNLSPKMKQFLSNEVNRTQQLEMYLWDRMARFILDQIYVMLDQDKEQRRNDYYVGRSFVFMQEMTNILSWRYKNFKKPEGYERIEKLAKFYTDSRKEYGSVLKNLEANSDLYKQKNIYDTKEFRSYMKRQWEILYLQNAKAEEAANNGLNMYIWSVRNTTWILQSIFSAKREELSVLIQRDVSGKLLTPQELLSRSKISMMYETLLHNLTLEYVGIREEIMNRLGKDIESTQRMAVLENLKEFLTDREKLDGLGMAQNDKTNGTTL
jgi:hypothetical protein